MTKVRSSVNEPRAGDREGACPPRRGERRASRERWSGPRFAAVARTLSKVRSYGSETASSGNAGGTLAKGLSKEKSQMVGPATR